MGNIEQQKNQSLHDIGMQLQSMNRKMVALVKVLETLNQNIVSGIQTFQKMNETADRPPFEVGQKFMVIDRDHVCYGWQGVITNLNSGGIFAKIGGALFGRPFQPHQIEVFGVMSNPDQLEIPLDDDASKRFQNLGTTMEEAGKNLTANVQKIHEVMDKERRRNDQDR